MIIGDCKCGKKGVELEMMELSCGNEMLCKVCRKVIDEWNDYVVEVGKMMDKEKGGG
jgi:hypothetical protein